MSTACSSALREERVAAYLHSLWIGWAGTLLEEEHHISDSRAERWIKRMVPYGELSDDMKDKARAYAKTMLADLEALDADSAS